MTKKTIVIKLLSGKWPTEFITVPSVQESHLVVERWQSSYRAAFPGASDAVSWQVIDGGLVDALTQVSSYFLEG